MANLKPQPAPLRSFRAVVDFYRLNWPTLLLIAVVAIIVYARGLGGQFLSADDTSSIVQNQALRNFPQVAKSLNFTSTYYSALISVFGVNPLPFHMGSLVVHILNSYLVLLLAYTLFGRRVALYASLIFCVLPAGSEAVFWIAGMGYVFQAFFSLLCLNSFFIYNSLPKTTLQGISANRQRKLVVVDKTTQNWRFPVISAVVYLIALVILQTPWMLTVPFILVSLDLFSDAGLYRRALAKSLVSALKSRWYYLIYIISSATFWLVWIKGQFSGRVSGLVSDYYFNSAESTTLLKRAPYTIYKAAELYIFPWRLSFFHEESLSTLVYTLMVVVSLSIVLLVAYLIYKRSKYAGLLLAIAASIAPTFSPVQVAWFIAERYLYLCGAFFAMIVSLILVKIDYKYIIKNLATYVLATLLVLYSARLFIRAADFKTSKTLWLATQTTAPTSYRVYNNLGDVYSNEQNWGMAIASFKKSVDLFPDYADAIHNLGYTYMQIGDYANAKKYLLESYQKNGRLWQALEKLGQIELKQGNAEKAKEYFEEAWKTNPQIKGLPGI